MEENSPKEGQKMRMEEGFSNVHVTAADTGQVNEEKEVKQIERQYTKSGQRVIHSHDFFIGTTKTGGPIRVVLTKGVAGVGKTVLTQKYSLDWAEGRGNPDIHLLFCLTFKELNEIGDQQFSMVGLVHHFFQNSKMLFSFQYIKLLLIFDGLDQCRFPLDFSQTRVLKNPTESASLEVLLVNLIRGNLFPDARVWITTRPAAASWIPAQYVSVVSEVRGFTDPQKEQFFRKRFNDERQALAVISHMRSIRSLNLMCCIPIFCWILFTVSQKILKTKKGELPKTLTETYVQFLLLQGRVKKTKFPGKSGADLCWTPETRKMLMSPGKLIDTKTRKRCKKVT